MNSRAVELFQSRSISERYRRMVIRGMNNPIILRRLVDGDRTNSQTTIVNYDISKMRVLFDEFIDRCSDEEIERIYSMNCWIGI